MPSLEIRNQVWLVWPGTASAFPPSSGIHHEWMTSEEVMSSAMVVPTDTTIALDITSSDVIHSWWIPLLGGKADAVPGHTNHTWFRISKEGIYRGVCAELCGYNHADMRAAVRAVSPARFAEWARRKRAQIRRAGQALAAERRVLLAMQKVEGSNPFSRSQKGVSFQSPWLRPGRVWADRGL